MGGNKSFQFTRPNGPRWKHATDFRIICYFNSRDLHGPRSAAVGEKVEPYYFNSRDHTGRDFLPCYQKLLSFQFTRPYRPRCVYHCSLNVLMSISIHATPTGRDYWVPYPTCFCLLFQFTRLLRAAIFLSLSLIYRVLFQFTRPLRAAIAPPQRPQTA